MSEGVAPTQGLLVLQKKEQERRHGEATEPPTPRASSRFTHICCLQLPCSGDKSRAQRSLDESSKETGGQVELRPF